LSSTELASTPTPPSICAVPISPADMPSTRVANSTYSAM